MTNKKEIRFKIPSSVHKIVKNISYENYETISSYVRNLVYEDIKRNKLNRPISTSTLKITKSPTTCHMDVKMQRDFRRYCAQNGLTLSSGLQLSAALMTSNSPVLLSKEVTALEDNKRALDRVGRNINQAIKEHYLGETKPLNREIITDLAKRVSSQSKASQAMLKSALNRQDNYE